MTKTVWLLSVVSLLADMASEMLYPVMPVYLKEIGFSFAAIGLLEGLAEAVAGLSKGYFGRLSDRTGRRVPFVRGGYLASAIAKPLLAVWTWPAWIFAVRTLDRIGKGLRTGARDALLSAEATKETKAQVFGFHRSMDTVGAVLGPVLALIYLHFYPGQYAALFFIAFAPGLLSVAATFFLKEKNAPVLPPAPSSEAAARPEGFFSFLKYWKKSSPAYRRLVVGLLLFALFNSSDAFLLLKMKSAGVADTTLIGAYIFYNLVYAFAAWPLGILADKIGLKRVFVGGLLLFALTYAGFAATERLPVFFLLFLAYGCYAAATEGVAKAWITNVCEKKDAATAVGTFSAFQSLAMLAASATAGVVWQFWGAGVAFGLSAAAALAAAAYLVFLK